MTPPLCPTDDHLAAFARNALPRERMDALAGHLVRCGECEQRLGLLADDGPPTPVMTETLVPGARPTAPPALGGALLDDRYILRDRLGSGGMGFVYRADQLRPVARTVAVKVMRPGMDTDEFLARFEGERQAVARMDHPNIARVFDAGTTTDGRPFLALELVDGLAVTQHADARRLTTRERVALFVPVCRALEHAHQKGVIHRDIKPSNILVGEVDGRAVPKVIDFGIAKAVGGGEAARTAAGVVIGTPEYMSPEQAGLSGTDVDTRSDVYALGVVLYELLAGSTPFRPADDNRPVWELLQNIRESDPPPAGSKLSEPGVAAQLADARRCSPDLLKRELRGELQWVLLRALDRDRAKRYQSAAALADDLERYLADEPLLAGPPSASYRVRKFVARNKGGVAAAAVVAVALAAGLAGTAVGLVNSVRAEGRARDALAAEGVARAEAERSAAQARADQRAAEEARAQADKDRTQAEKDRADAERAKAAADKDRAAAEVANKRVQLALFAVTDTFTGGPFGRQPQITPGEEQYLKVVGGMLRALGKADAGVIPEDLRAECLFRLGLILLRLGRGPDAEKTFLDAMAVQEKLHAADPTAPQPRSAISTLSAQLGLMASRRGTTEEVRRQMKRATDMADGVTTTHPTVEHAVFAAKIRGLYGDYLVRTGSREQGKAEVAAARAVLERYACEFPDLKLVALELAAVLDYQAAAADEVDDEKAAAASAGSAAAWLELALRRDPNDLEAVGQLARVLTLLARNTPGPAGTAVYQRAAAYRKRLMTDYPAIPAYRAEYAATAANLAARLQDEGKLSAAAAFAADALAIRTRMVAEEPDDPARLIYLAHAQMVAARQAHLKGDAKTAADLIDKAVAGCDRRLVLEPKRPVVREIHSLCHRERARQATADGRYADAADDWKASAATAREPNEPTAQRALALARASKPAAEVLDTLKKTPDLRPATLFLIARAYAVMGADFPDSGHTKNAADGLLRAIKAGLPDDPEVKWHPDFDPIRRHKDFAPVLDQLKAREPLPPPRRAE